MWISKHNRGGQSVLFWGWGEREKARTATRHGLGPRAERLGTGTGAGRAGCVGPAGAPRREGWAHPHTHHTQPGMHALHPLLTHPRCAHSSLGTQGHPHTSTPERGGALPTVSTAWRTQPSGEQGTSFRFFRRREVRREIRGEALAEHGPLLRPQPPICATGPGVWPLWDRGRDG